MTIERMVKAGKYDKRCFPGGYNLLYITADNSILCAKCANENFEQTTDEDDPQWYIIGMFINYEDPCVYCDHCNQKLEPEYDLNEN